MNILFLLFYFIIITAVIEIFVVLFRLTGLEIGVSRFQVISLMTGTGFTTGESELIIGHPIRRKLATFLILFSAFSLAVIISSISNFLSDDLRMKNILYAASGFLLVFGILKVTWIQNIISKLFHKKMEQNIELGDLPIRDVFLTDKEDDLLNLHIYKDSSLAFKTINQVINEHNLVEFVALFIKRGEMKIRRNIYDEKLCEGDQLFLFGKREVIHEFFKDDICIMEEMLKNQNHTPFTKPSS